jgi:thioredoxin reductase (NADPH)
MQSIREQRRDQMFPKLDPVEIQRVRRFGEVRSFAAGESLGIIGQITPGVIVISTITSRSSPMSEQLPR